MKFPTPVTVTAGALVFGLKPGESMLQRDHVGCIDAPTFVATGQMAVICRNTYTPMSVCRDAANDFSSSQRAKS